MESQNLETGKKTHLFPDSAKRVDSRVQVFHHWIQITIQNNIYSRPSSFDPINLINQDFFYSLAISSSLTHIIQKSPYNHLITIQDFPFHPNHHHRPPAYQIHRFSPTPSYPSHLNYKRKPKWLSLWESVEKRSEGEREKGREGEKKKKKKKGRT